MPSSCPVAGDDVGGPAAAPPMRESGVPARCAQPGRNGPSAVQAAVATTATAVAIWNPNRLVPVLPVSKPIRQPTAATTVSVQPATMASDHHTGASVPVPSEWRVATGHDA